MSGFGASQFLRCLHRGRKEAYAGKGKSVLSLSVPGSGN